ncbi:hypothetical protein B0G76_4775 [Paraburkholderia sp. BL23I1N1]|nr:hypothetical protein B0G76_4775 [Paraburkholderia sp. BL23I1N1]
MRKRSGISPAVPRRPPLDRRAFDSILKDSNLRCCTPSQTQHAMPVA